VAKALNPTSRPVFSIEAGSGFASHSTSHRVPPSGLSLIVTGLDLAFNRTMQFDPDGADSLQPQFAVIEQFASVAVAGKGDAIVAARAREIEDSPASGVLTAIKESIEALSTRRSTS